MLYLDPWEEFSRELPGVVLKWNSKDQTDERSDKGGDAAKKEPYSEKIQNRL